MWCRVRVEKPPGPEIGRDVDKTLRPHQLTTQKHCEHKRSLRATGSIGWPNWKPNAHNAQAEKVPTNPRPSAGHHAESRAARLLDCSKQGNVYRKMARFRILHYLAEHDPFVRTTHGSLTISCAGIREGGVIESRASSMMPQGTRRAPASPYVSASSSSSLCAVFGP
jgi:hypothetical protein